MRPKISWLFAMVFLGFAVYYFMETRKLKRTIDEHIKVFQIVREELDRKNAEIEILNRAKLESTGESGEDITSLTIIGEFLGWNGNTVFNLSDGSVWQQAKHDVLFFRALNPEVQITNSGGSFFLQVKGVDRKIMVRKIK